MYGVISEIIDTHTSDKLEIAKIIDQRVLEITHTGYEILDITNEFSENSKVLIQYR